MIKIFAEDCLDIEKKIGDESVDLGINDPPFGIGETDFDKHYNRDNGQIIQGYKEAPPDYDQWTFLWMSEAKRVLKENGSMYIIMGHSNLRHVLNAAYSLNLYEINHIIWKYNFGVNTKKKYVTSHYHILHYSKSEKSRVVFNLNCRFGCQEKDNKGGSLLYQDLEDVFSINKEYLPVEMKNQNKLPEALIRKLMMYSSNPGDMVCDFFMGNFTTAYTAIKLGRNVCGYEINKGSFDYHVPKIRDLTFGFDLENLKPVRNIVPVNQGKSIEFSEASSICRDYSAMCLEGMTKKKINEILQGKYGRGKFSIKNIIDHYRDLLRN